MSNCSVPCDRIPRKIETIETRNKELQSKQSLSRSELKNSVTEKRAVAKMFEDEIQACIDLAKHISSCHFGHESERDDGLGSKEEIDNLHEEGVISKDTKTRSNPAVGFRHKVAHEYDDLDYDQIYDYLQNKIEIYLIFATEVAQWYQEKSRES